MIFLLKRGFSQLKEFVHNFFMLFLFLLSAFQILFSVLMVVCMFSTQNSKLSEEIYCDSANFLKKILSRVAM